jgi:homoserine dehydrogenase
MNIDLVMIGFGNVGQAFIHLLDRKRDHLQRSYGWNFQVTGIATAHHGCAIDPAGLDTKRAIQILQDEGTLQTISTHEPFANIKDFLKTCPAQVLLENSPVNHHSGQPALDYIRMALERGMHAITANKGPVVYGYRELTDLAKANDCCFLFESSVMDGAPIFSLFRTPLPAVELHGFSGILNSCTNLLLGLMEQGQTLEQAILYGQSIGITETDPAADVDGLDAAIKVAALSTVLMGIPLTVEQIHPLGIRDLTVTDVQKAKQEGKRWKLICQAERTAEGFRASVTPQQVASNSPFFAINGTSSYVEFHLDTLPALGIVETDPGPMTTAYGLLADLINALRGI